MRFRSEISSIAANGVFDRQTVTAVKEYEEFAGLPVTGEVNKTVWDSIANTYKTVASSATPRPLQFPGYAITSGDQDPEL